MFRPIAWKGLARGPFLSPGDSFEDSVSNWTPNNFNYCLILGVGPSPSTRLARPTTSHIKVGKIFRPMSTPFIFYHSPFILLNR